MAEAAVNFYNFSNMHIDLSKVSASQTVLEVFPELQHETAFTEATDEEIKLSLLMCDPRGPFSTIKQYDTRLINVCRWLKIPLDAPDNKLFQDVLNLRSEKVANLWTAYLSSMFNHEWTSWFSSSLMYYQMMTELRKPIDFTAQKDWQQRQAIEGRADAIYNRMKKMEEIVFIDQAIKRKAFESEKGKIENFPEKHADENSVV